MQFVPLLLQCRHSWAYLGEFVDSRVAINLHFISAALRDLPTVVEPLIWMREHREREMARHEVNTSTRRLIDPRIALHFFGELVHDIGVLY